MDEERNRRGSVFHGAAVLLAIGIALGGWLAGRGFVASRTADRFVTVKGVAERDVQADLAWESDAPMVRITITDTGPGIDEEAAERLFEPYFSTKTTGTGLGLAICRNLSREMGGDVTVENLPDRAGVKATLYLKSA